MSNILLTPNMFLTEPGIGNTLSPTWAQDLNNNFTTIDQHNHSPGQGIQITPAGLNISADLTFQGNNAIGLRSTRYTPLSLGSLTGSDLSEIVVSSNAAGDLYYVNSLGQQVQITNGSSIAGASGSIAGLVSPASATYISASQTFVWQSNSGVAANMDAGTLIVRYPGSYPTPAGSFIALQAPSSLSSGFSLTLPIPPAVTSFLQIDNSGLITDPIPVSQGITAANIANQTITATQIANQTITATQIANQTITAIQIANQTITATQIADSTITNTQLAFPNIVNFGAAHNFTTSSTSPVSTGLSVSITTVGKPVSVIFQPYSAFTAGYLILEQGPGTLTISGFYEIRRDGIAIAYGNVAQVFSSGVVQLSSATIPLGCLNFVDMTPSAGSHTYELFLQSANTSAVIGIEGATMVLLEL